jgi:hypothetical protein
MTSEEKRAYAKGYNAGRRNAAADRSKAARDMAEQRFWQQVFCAALQGAMISGNWATDNKRWADQVEYVRGCGRFADEAVKQHGWRA